MPRTLMYPSAGGHVILLQAETLYCFITSAVKIKRVIKSTISRMFIFSCRSWIFDIFANANLWNTKMVSRQTIYRIDHWQQKFVLVYIFKQTYPREAFMYGHSCYPRNAKSKDINSIKRVPAKTQIADYLKKKGDCKKLIETVTNEIILDLFYLLERQFFYFVIQTFNRDINANSHYSCRLIEICSWQICVWHLHDFSLRLLTGIVFRKEKDELCFWCYWLKWTLINVDFNRLYKHRLCVFGKKNYFSTFYSNYCKLESIQALISDSFFLIFK